MTQNADGVFDAAFMEALFDLVIPPGDDGTMPGAGSLGLTEPVVAALEGDAMLGAAVRAGLRAIRDAASASNPHGLAGLGRGTREELVRALLNAHPMLMPGLARHLYPAYYQHPRVLEALGEPARPPFPEGFQIEPTDAGLLAKLESRRRHQS